MDRGPRPNTLAVAYDDLIGEQERTLAAVVSFIQGNSGVDATALARALAQAHEADFGIPTLAEGPVKRLDHSDRILTLNEGARIEIEEEQRRVLWKPVGGAARWRDFP
jgi:hypothetical protein